MTIKINKTILVYLTVFVMTILIGYIYLAQSNDIYNTEQTYELTDHNIEQRNDKQPNNIKHKEDNLSDKNTLVGTIE